MDNINLLPEDLRGEEEKELARSEGKSAPTAFYIPPKEKAEGQVARPYLEPAKTPLITPAPAPVKTPPLAPPKPDHRLTPPKLMTDAETGLNQPRRESLLTRLFKKKQKGKILKNVVEKNYSNRLPDKQMDVNLIPEGADLLPLKKIYSHFTLAAVIGLFVLAIVYLGLVFYQSRIKSREQALTLEIAQSEAKYNELKKQEKELTGWLERISAVKNLFSEHVYWTNFFKVLEEATIQGVYYKDITSSVQGDVVLTAVADSYLSVARQYLAYQEISQEAAGNPAAKQLIKTVEISGLMGNAETGEVNFLVNLSFLPEVYKLAPQVK